MKATYSAVVQETDSILEKKDYPRALAVFNHKGLVPCAGTRFGLKGSEFADYLQRLVASKKGQPLIEAMRKACPVIEVGK